MSGRQAGETKYALQLHLVDGKSVHQAAKIAGIYASTLYRALNELKKKEKKKKLDSVA